MTGLAALVLSGAGLLAAERSRRLARPIDQLRDNAVLLGTGGTLEPGLGSGLSVDAVPGALVDAHHRLKAALERERSLSTDLAHQLRTLLTSAARPLPPLATCVRAAGERWAGALTGAGRDLRVDIEPHLPWVNASPVALRQALDVLLDNALRHGAGTVRVTGRGVGAGAVVSVTEHRAPEP